ncbi:hypothetical protein ZWY2020_020276 [Hordeum vulgare]|nr:hypothetical protein ZWY2020_020276 [Hordeum vulgare]
MTGLRHAGAGGHPQPQMQAARTAKPPCPASPEPKLLTLRAPVHLLGPWNDPRAPDPWSRATPLAAHLPLLCTPPACLTLADRQLKATASPSNRQNTASHASQRGNRYRAPRIRTRAITPPHRHRSLTTSRPSDLSHTPLLVASAARPDDPQPRCCTTRSTSRSTPRRPLQRATGTATAAVAVVDGSGAEHGRGGRGFLLRWSRDAPVSSWGDTGARGREFVKDLSIS